MIYSICKKKGVIKMKVVVNHCYGGFSLPDDFCKKYNLERYTNIDRTDPRLIEYVEKHPEQRFNFSKLAVVEVPDEATDWEINDYDGSENIIAVIDGKIVWL